MEQPVLVPFDGSRNAMRALDHVIAHTGRRVPIHVLNVELPLDEYGMVPAYLTPRKHREVTAQRARALLEPAIERLAAARRKHSTHVVWGEPGASIARTARRLKCSGIVMGTRGMGALGNLLLGSVASKVIHLSKVPVTLVK